MTYILFVVGFVFLIRGANLFVEGSSSIAKRFGISDLVIGLTLVSFGTSAPELFVNIFSSIKGNGGLVLGNILGSNISNILLILGVSALIFPLTLKKSTIYKEIPFSLVAVVILGALIYLTLFDKVSYIFSRIDGIILLVFFALFLYYIFLTAKHSREGFDLPTASALSKKKSFLFIALGLIGLVFGGNRIVNGAAAIATYFGLSETVIGLTIVAIGTSLPELATSAVAAYKGESDIAIGNVVGSNIFNIFWILGVSVLIRPIIVNPIIMRDVWFLIFATLILLAFVVVGKKFILRRHHGLFMILVYFAYIAILLLDSGAL